MRECEKTTPQAIEKAKEIQEFGNQFFGPNTDYDYDKALLDMKTVAEKFGGECHHTGGGVYCTVIPFDKYHCIGINDESVVLYRSEEPRDDMYNIFWESDGEQEPLYFHSYCE